MDPNETTATEAAPDEPIEGRAELMALFNAQAAHARGLQIAQLSRTHPVVAELVGENEALKARVAELEAKAGKGKK